MATQIKRAVTARAKVPPATASKKVTRPVADHRSRTGALRRERTRKRLLATALGVFAKKGADAAQIEDFIAAAGVARGTFYNYFNTAQELLSAVTSDLSDSIFASIEAVVEGISDPLQRLATACLLHMHAGITVPNLGAFLARTGLRGEALGKLVDVYLPRDLEMARAAGEVIFPSVRAARDLLIASHTQAIQSVNAGSAPPVHLRQMLSLTLRALGVPEERAQALSGMELPELLLPEWVSA